MTSNQTRRGMLAALALAGSVWTVAAGAAELPASDPIFAAIQAHRRAAGASHEAAGGTDQKATLAAHAAAAGTFAALCRTVPTTNAGIAALVNEVVAELDDFAQDDIEALRTAFVTLQMALAKIAR
jgi:hypothetical protein